MRNLNLLTVCFALLLVNFFAGCKTTAWRTPSPYMVLGDRVIPLDELPMGKEVFMAAVMSSPLIMVKLKDGNRKGARFCSGVLIAGKDAPRVLTTQSCFKQTAAKETPDIISNACANTVVYFDKHDVPPRKKGDIVPKLERGCKSGSLRTSFAGNIAVFTLSEGLSSNYKVTEIWQEDEIIDKRKVFSIYYPSGLSPIGRIKPEKIEGGFNGKAPPKLMNMANCHIDQRLPPSFHQDPKLQHMVHKLPYAVAHNCIIKQGLGAGLIDMETGKLLALHYGQLQAGEHTLPIATHVLHLRQFLNGEKIALP